MKKIALRKIKPGLLMCFFSALINYDSAAQTPYGCDGVTPTPTATYGASAVSFPCAPSTSPTSSFTTIYQKKENYIPDNSKTEALYVEKVIKMRITVIQEIVGSKKNYEPSDITFIKNIVATANDYLANNQAPSDPITIDGRNPHVYDTRFSIQLVGSNDGVTFRDDVDLQYEDLNSVTDPMSAYPSLLYDYDNVLNVFIVFANTNSIPGGIACAGPEGTSGPSHLLTGYNSKTPYIILKNFYTAGLGLESAANYLLHEIGHTMDIHHIYEYDYGTLAKIAETIDETHFDYLKDVFNVGSSKIAYRPSNNATYPSYPYYFYNPGNPATANDEYTNNFMGGHPLGHYYSPMQIGRMHRNAHFLGCRKFIYNKWPEDENHENVGQGQIHPLEVSSNQTWDFDIKMYSDIRIKTGATLTITCRVMMPYHSNIIVEPGAKLILDGGIITSDKNFNNYFWYGISIWGDISKSQDLSGAQGIVEIINNGTIENALHGVVAGDDVYRDNRRAGGIIRVSNGNFINNKNAVGFWKFENKATWPAGIHKPNRSYVYSSSFELNDDYHYDDNTQARRKPQGQISIWDVDGVRIQGCTMENKMSIAKRSRIESTGGMGIISFEGDFLLDQYTPFVPSGTTTLASTVKGFAFGINAGGVASKPFTATNTSFQKNLYGVLTDGVYGQQIINNTFIVKDPSTTSGEATGIRVYGSNGYKIQSNLFTLEELIGFYPKGKGIRIEESSSDNNKINNNTFRKVNIACISLGMHTNGYNPFNDNLNTGLSFLCNTFIQTNADIKVMGYDDTKDGIRSNQGLTDRPAGNQFTYWGASSSLGMHFDMQKSGSTDKVMPVQAYYYSTSSGIRQQPTKYTPGRVNPVARFVTNQCELLSPEDESSFSKIGRIGSTTSYTSLALAMSDSSENRNSIIAAALEGMHSPYADAERSLFYIRQGLINDGLNLYDSIFTNPSYALNSKELAEFTIGRSLVNLLAQHVQYDISMDSLSPGNIDTLHYITANALSWPRAKACAWLRFALEEECDITMVPDEPIDSNENYQRRSPELLSQHGSNSLMIQPNPSSSHFSIHYQLDKEAEMLVYDVNGRLMTKTTLEPAKNTQPIDATQWPSGVYLYRLMQGEQTLYYGKLLKY